MIRADDIKDHILKKSIEAMEKLKNDLQAPEVIDVSWQLTSNSCTVMFKKTGEGFVYQG